jgi:tRNA threonylcarbamoyladenosine biosynthesis protein TsaB
MVVLGIETTGRLGGFGIARDGGRVVEVMEDMTGSHVERGIGMLVRTLELAGTGLGSLDGLAVSIGPGSFTGVRVGLAMAKGIAFARKIPLAGVPTLDCMAGATEAEGLVVPVRDARRGEIYFSIYLRESGSLTRLDDYLAAEPGQLVERVKPHAAGRRVTLTGDAISRYGDAVAGGLGPGVEFAPETEWAVRPGTVAALGLELLKAGGACDPAALEPLYVRASEAERQAGRDPIGGTC